MTNQQILTKAIQKAIDGGRKQDWYPDWSLYDGEFSFNDYGDHYHVFELIYQHDFAKALWGEKDPMIINDDTVGGNPWKQPWQYHLQQMVIADDPIKYLGENI